LGYFPFGGLIVARPPARPSAFIASAGVISFVVVSPST
jgi:hypothetical protein